MPERMSDGKFSGLWQRAAQGAADRHDAYDLAHEAARARAEVEEKDEEIRRLTEIVSGQKAGAIVVVAVSELDQKDAMIKALADALLTTGEHHEDLGGWHTDRCLLDGIGVGASCTDLCAQRRAALRLAGRL